ncbi:unnamed protein product [Blepharisma stoltei]|uniref:Uncharacterized protein n=1 Tax=Blepharisma stoltei TaxID=1481888 RepID=A0AAU9JN75_9CILI|nr:unnamed protein product [Blepharisma stoltei]
MNVLKCYDPLCTQRAEMLCKCTGFEIFMCNYHINEHVSAFLGWSHNFIPIEASQKQNKTMIDLFSDIKQQTQKVKNESLEIFSKCVSCFESLMEYSLQNIDFHINTINEQISAFANIDKNSKIYEEHVEELSKGIESLLVDNENLKIVNSINRFMEEIIKITENIAKHPFSAIKEFLDKFEQKPIQINQNVFNEELKKHENFIKSWADDFSDFPSRSHFWYCKKEFLNITLGILCKHLMISILPLN